MNEENNQFKQGLTLLQAHCEEQQQFVTKALARLRSLAGIHQRQRDRLLLEVMEDSPKWKRLMTPQIELIRQANQQTRHKAKLMFTRQRQELASSMGKPQNTGGQSFAICLINNGRAGTMGRCTQVVA